VFLLRDSLRDFPVKNGAKGKTVMNPAGGPDSRLNDDKAREGESPRVFVAGGQSFSRRFGWVVVLALAAGAAVVAYVCLKNRAAHSGAIEAEDVQRSTRHRATVAGQSSELVDRAFSSPAVPVGMAGLRGAGGGSGPLSFIQLSEYEGEDALPPADSESILWFAGLSTPRPDTAKPESQAKPNAVPLCGEDRAWALLLAGAGLEDPRWGVMRRWQSFRLKSGRTLADLLAMPGIENNPALLDRAVWLIGGLDRRVAVREDGEIVETVLQRASDAELEAARQLLLKTAAAADAQARATAARGLGELLALDPRVQLPPDHPLIATLAKLLKDEQLEVACSAALALGNTAAVSGLQLLVQCVENDVSGKSLPCALVAFRQAEALGRRLDASALSAENSDLRRALFEKMRLWLVARASAKSVPPPPLLAAALLRLSEVLPPGPGWEGYAEELCNVLVESKQSKAADIAAEFRTRANPAILNRTAQAQTLGEVAGPLWRHYDFTLARAAEMLLSKDRELTQAALWRLSRIGNLAANPEIDQELMSQVAERAGALAAGAVSSRVRRVALDALYREHTQPKNSELKGRWRLYSAPDIALEVFMKDDNAQVQLAAALALGSLAGHAEIGLLSPGIGSRSPVAVEQLLRGLVGRYGKESANDEYAQALGALVDQVVNAADPALAVAGVWARLNDPRLDAEQKIRLVQTFKDPTLRVRAIQVLGEQRERAKLQPEMIRTLLKDDSEYIRAAVFESDLPEFMSSKAEVDKLLLLGLGDANDVVQLAVLKSRPLIKHELRQEVKAKVTELSASGAPAVRAAAAALLRK
jgi:hypothetical protein